MNVTLYKNTSDNNKMNKSITADGSAISCTIKDTSNMIDPEIILAGSYFDPDDNYMYIDDFNRYYFITDVTVEHQRIVLHGHVDVLYTYASAIEDLYVIADRSSSYYNLYQKDNEIPFEARSRVTMSPFSGKFNGEGIILTCTGNGV